MIETALAIRSLFGSTTCVPPHANRPSGRPSARAAWNTASASRVAVIAIAAAVDTRSNLAVLIIGIEGFGVADGQRRPDMAGVSATLSRASPLAARGAV